MTCWQPSLATWWQHLHSVQAGSLDLASVRRSGGWDQLRAWSACCRTTEATYDWSGRPCPTCELWSSLLGS